MILSNNAIVVNYPNQRGDAGRYPLFDQRDYFKKFEGGSNHIFELALNNVVGGDLLAYTDSCNEIYDSYYRAYEVQCSEVFDNHYFPQFQDNTVNLKHYHDDRREFNRRIFDVYRYAKTSLAVLGENTGFSMVRRLSTNPQFDSGSFLLK
jgi:hypothetical protein